MAQPSPSAQPDPSQPARRLPPAPGGRLRDMVRDPLQFFLNLTAQNGDVVCYRSAPDPAYIVNHPDYVRHVLVDNNRNYTKATSSNQVFDKIVGEGLLTSEGETWRRQRRMMQPAFHHARIEHLDGLIVSAARAMLEGWDRLYESGQPVDIAREMAALTLNITTQALFGVDLGEDARRVGELVNRGVAFLEKPSDPRLVESAEEIKAITRRIIRQRKQDFKDAGDLLSSLILSRDPETGMGMDDEQLRSQVMTLMLAGYETTANALAWTWVLLSQNPEAAGRMTREVRSALGEREPAYPDLENMPYTRLVLNESLRMFPPAWTLGRRAVGEDEIGGWYVAPGTVIAICTYALHRHPAFWDRPEVFDPERFSPENSAGRNKYAYVPFGGGPRQCIGNMFGLMEASLILACIARRYELRLVPGTEVKPQALFVLRPSRDLMMSLQR
ncbi:MAG TPA: cytochrome P450 [Anaerolineales bacterium]|nr:cytochrome P450 [Anaerolineales bacterium]